MSQLGFLPNYKLHFGYFNHKKWPEIISNYANTSLSHLKKWNTLKLLFLKILCLITWLMRQIVVFSNHFTCNRKSKSAILDHSWWWISVQPHSALGTLPFCQHFFFNSCWYCPHVNLTEEWVLLSVGLSEESQRITGQAWPPEKRETKYHYYKCNTISFIWFFFRHCLSISKMHHFTDLEGEPARD